MKYHQISSGIFLLLVQFSNLTHQSSLTASTNLSHLYICFTCLYIILTYYIKLPITDYIFLNLFISYINLTMFFFLFQTILCLNITIVEIDFKDSFQIDILNLIVLNFTIIFPRAQLIIYTNFQFYLDKYLVYFPNLNFEDISWRTVRAKFVYIHVSAALALSLASIHSFHLSLSIHLS